MLIAPSSQSIQGVQWAAVAGISLTAAVFDVRTGRIPNWLTAAAFLAGITWCVCIGGVSKLGDGVGACALIGLPYVLLFLFAGGGAADAKLMGALGVWLGIHNGIVLLIAVLGAGAVLGIGYAIAKQRIANVVANISLILLGLKRVLVGRHNWSEATGLIPDPDVMLKVPYGLSICAGTLIAAVGSLAWHAW